MRGPYTAHANFIRPAWAVRSAWRVLAMIIAFEVIFTFAYPLFAAFMPHEWAEAMDKGTSAFGTLAQFFSFGVVGVGFVVALQFIHGRGLWSLVGSIADMRRDLIRVTWAVCSCLLVIELLPPWINIADLAEIRALNVWLAFVPITVVALFIQVGTEEIVFRGYLQQQFACLSRSPLIWMLLPSIMFGSIHYWNGNGAADGVLWAIWATALGMACADLTARTGNLGAAIGLHLANNIFALLVVAVKDWPASGVALFIYPYEDPALYAYGLDALLSPWMVLRLVNMLTIVAIMWLVARIALRR